MTVRKTATYASGLTRQIPSWQRVVLAAVVMALALVQLSGSRAAVAATPAEVGQWSAPVAWPLVAVHMSLEPTGQVFTLDGFADGPNSERLWDPSTGVFLPIPYGRNLFCAGHIQLADGRTLLVGGHINANEGLADITGAARVPVLAIGGVNPARVGELIAAGAVGVAVMGGVMRAADPAPETKALIAALTGSLGIRARHRC